MEIAVLAAIAIIVVTAWAPRIGTSAPLLLVLLGVGISLLPQVGAFEIEPEWILAGVLPPLLYATSVSMPTMDFRRDFTAISGLSVVLVVISSVALGFGFAWLIPGIGLPVGIALGAIVSPTDAVATSIVRRLGVSPRLVTVLEGESLLNDASALVLLRSAIAATSGTVALWGIVGDFVFAVVVAVAIGVLVGGASLMIRRRTTDTSITTAISFVVPFVAYFPAERFGASGLVATVSAGIVAGAGGARYLHPQVRLAEAANWRTLELLVEGAVFLFMGLELFGFIQEAQESGRGVAFAFGLAALAATSVVVLRTGYVAMLLWSLRRRRRRKERSRELLADVRHQLDDGALVTDDALGRRRGYERVRPLRSRVTRRLADLDYLAAERLGPKEGAVLVWAGMRGAVTVAAAQTLPAKTPERATLVLIAFFVAVGTLLIQGGSLPWLVRRLGLARPDAVDPQERAQLLALLHEAAAGVLDDPELRRPDGSRYDEQILAQVRRLAAKSSQAIEDQEDPSGVRARLAAQSRQLRLTMITAQREALLQARTLGTFSSAALESALRVLDADQISAELREQGNGAP